MPHRPVWLFGRLAMAWAGRIVLTWDWSPPGAWWSSAPTARTCHDSQARLAAGVRGHPGAGQPQPAAHRGRHAWLERLAWLLPLAAIPTAFAWTFGFGSPGQSRLWLAARSTLAALVGLNACPIHLIDAIDYAACRNSGVLGVWVIGLLAGLVAFAASALALGAWFWKRRPS